jgi:hypothetical protein
MTAVLMNVVITRPIIHEMRDNFQQRSRELVYHFQNNKEHFTSPLSFSSATSVMVLWILIRIRKDPKLLAGSGSVTRGYGSGFGSETGLKPYKKSSKKLAI